MVFKIVSYDPQVFQNDKPGDDEAEESKGYEYRQEQELPYIGCCQKDQKDIRKGDDGRRQNDVEIALVSFAGSESRIELLY